MVLELRPGRLVILVIAATILALYTIADSFLFHQRDIQACQMSYSRPSFRRFPVTSRLSNKYEMYLYREGGVDDPNKLTGVPALFIPGHAGSYKQVRSIAGETAQYQPSLDFFTVDLNEEFSAISGRLLLDQAEYLNDVVQHILALYQHRFSSVVIVGHSMGGIVARLMPTLANYQPHSINTILTLASPHAKAPIVLDPKIARIYQSSIHPIASNITIMSLAGGTSDSIVNSDAASLSSDPGGLTAFTTSIPQVWTTCDHMAILWCNQLVKRVGKALVEITNKNDISGTRPFDDRIQIFQKYFAPSSITPVLKDYVNVQDASIVNDPRTAIAMETNQMKLIRSKGLMGVLTNDEDLQLLTCGKDQHECRRIKNTAIRLPTSTSTDTHSSFHGSSFWFHQVDAEQYLGIQSTQKDTFVVTDTIDDASSMIVQYSMWDVIMQGVSIPIFDKLYSSISIPAIRQPLLAYQLTLTFAGKCDTPPLFAPLVQQTFGDESKFHVGLIGKERSVIDINFYADPAMDHSLEIRVWAPYPMHVGLAVDWYGSIGKCILRAGPAIVVYIFVITLMVLQQTLQGGSLVSGLTRALKIDVPSIVAVVSLHGILSQRDAWWLHAASLFLAAGITCLLWAVLRLLQAVFRMLLWPVPLQYQSSMMWVPSAMALGLIRVLPVPVIVVGLYIFWLGVTARHQDPIREAVLLFLTSFMPYNVPGLIVYIRDVMQLGWQTPSWSMMDVLDDLPALAAVLLLIAMDRYSSFLKSRYFSYLTTVMILYYAIYGDRDPFPLHRLVHHYWLLAVSS